MFTEFRNRLTYFGTLDDVVFRYPWPRPLNLDTIRHELVTAAIYDKKILINDGYLIGNPHFIDELQNIQKSLLGNLLTSGTARIFARGNKTNLAEGLERNAAHIATHKALIEDKARWPEIRDDLEYASGQISNYTITWPTDKNMGELFYHLMQQVREMAAGQRTHLMTGNSFTDFDEIYARFEQNLNRQTFDGARTAWENACWQHFSERTVDPYHIISQATPLERERRFPGYIKVQGMMNIANEIYHLAYTIAAHHAIQTDKPATQFGATTINSSAIGVATSLITAFPKLVGYESVSEDTLDQTRLAQLNQLLISFPADMHFGDDFAFVSRIEADRNCRNARNHYLSALEAFVANTMGLAAATEARDTYRHALARVAQPFIPKLFIEKFVKSTVDVIVGTIPLPLGPLGGFLLSLGIDKHMNLMVERMVCSRLQASMLEDGIVATQTANSTPLARRLGLYMGPLKTDGAQSTIANISPHPYATSVA